MKKLFLGLAAVALLAGCSNGGGEEAGKYTAGTYTGTGTGMGGDVVVEVEVDANNILSVTVTEQNETAGTADPALEQVPAAIVEANGTEGVETVSGANITSQAILDAVDDALSQAAAQ